MRFREQRCEPRQPFIITHRFAPGNPQILDPKPCQGAYGVCRLIVKTPVILCVPLLPVVKCPSPAHTADTEHGGGTGY